MQRVYANEKHCLHAVQYFRSSAAKIKNADAQDKQTFEYE